MERIRQEFVVDAAQAVANLGQFNTALMQVGSSLDRIRGSRGGSGASSAVGQLDTQLRRATTSSQEFTVSWQTLTRVFATQVLVSALGSIRREFSETVDAAFEFQRQVSLIQTLTGPADLGASFEGISDSIRDIAAANNISVIDAATAAYNAQSNQVGNLAQSLQFTADSAVFARATNSSLADSVDLLSAAMRSFGLEASETQETASIFFTLIDKGRITADELANTFGRIGGPAATLGVNLDELGLAVAAISDKGFRTSETLTQFRGIVNSLAKPTPALADAVESIGFSSAQTAVQTLGLVETLRRLQGTTDGTLQSFSRLFPNIRGSTGILSILNTETGELNRTFEAFRESSAGLIEDKSLIVTATDAFTIEMAFNELRVEMDNVASGFLSVAANAVNLVRPFREVATGVTATAVSGAAGAAAMLSLGAAIVGVGRGLAILNANPFILALTATGAAAGIAIAAFNRLEQARFDSLTSELNSVVDASNEASKALASTLNGDDFDVDTGTGRGLRQIEADLNDIARTIGSSLVPAQRRYNDVVQNSIAANRELVDSTRNSLDSILNANEAILGRLTDQLESINDLSRESQDRERLASQSLSDRRQDRELDNLPDIAQAVQLSRRAATEAQAAAKNLVAAGTDELKIQQALDQFSRAEDLGERASQAASAAGNAGLELQIETQIDGIIQKRINSERALRTEQESRRDGLKAERDAQVALDRDLRAAAAVVAQNSAPLREDGTQFTAEENEDRARRRNEGLTRFLGLAEGNANIDAVSLLGITQQVQDLQSELANSDLQTGISLEPRIQELQDRLSQEKLRLEVEFETQDASQLARNFTESRGLPDPQSFGDEQAALIAAREALVLRQRLQNNVTVAQSTFDSNVNTAFEPADLSQVENNAAVTVGPFVDAGFQNNISDAAQVVGSLGEALLGVQKRFQETGNISATEVGRLAKDAATVNEAVGGLTNAVGLLGAPAELRAEAANVNTFALALQAAINAQSEVRDNQRQLTEQGDLGTGITIENLDRVRDNLVTEGPRLPEAAAFGAEAVADQVQGEQDLNAAKKATLETEQQKTAAAKETTAATSAPSEVDSSPTGTNIELDSLGEARSNLPGTQEVVNKFFTVTEAADKATTAINTATESVRAFATNPNEITNPFVGEQGLALDPARIEAANVASATGVEVVRNKFVQLESNIQSATERVGDLSTAISNIGNVDISGSISVNANPTSPDTGGPLSRQFGGPVFQNGGTARGVDTVPALLTPGESVLTPRATSRFFSQIQAMNSGQEPVFRPQTNGSTTIGDISITLQGGDSNESTARAVAQEIRRQTRRGNL